MSPEKSWTPLTIAGIISAPEFDGSTVQSGDEHAILHLLATNSNRGFQRWLTLADAGGVSAEVCEKVVGGIS